MYPYIKAWSSWSPSLYRKWVPHCMIRRNFHVPSTKRRERNRSAILYLRDITVICKLSCCSWPWPSVWQALISPSQSVEYLILSVGSHSVSLFSTGIIALCNRQYTFSLFRCSLPGRKLWLFTFSCKSQLGTLKMPSILGASISMLHTC